MHEMSVALAVVDQVERAARSGGAVRVESVRLEVGELAGVVPDALAFCFELACAGTVLEGAELITRSVPGTARCGACADVWDVGMPPQLICPACGDAAADLISGRELRIAEVRWTDVEAEADTDATQARIREPIPEESRACAE
ncbi:hydrogenase maturation nickel metallochaperone HypA [Streptomyces sp. NPDC006540]|jgi:hydrogenase nickel incorporation protein HypA/HybF|uniref:hydrogenase maturation nickel metallochaperone HypA n=1 Tax=Streptomyces sp. NPDC006540 TaxID=3155353 RepID=UPI0033A17444